jgi:hypothetical protein
MTLDQFFSGYALSRGIFEALRQSSLELGQAELQVSKTQVAFQRRIAFAWAYIPEKHLARQAAPLVLSVALRRRDGSPSWKQVVEPSPGRFIDHFELEAPEQIDAQVLLDIDADRIARDPVDENGQQGQARQDPAGRARSVAGFVKAGERHERERSRRQPGGDCRLK